MPTVGTRINTPQAGKAFQIIIVGTNEARSYLTENFGYRCCWQTSKKSRLAKMEICRYQKFQANGESRNIIEMKKAAPFLTHITGPMVQLEMTTPK